MWNGGKTNEVMNERIRKQINDFEHKYTEPTKVSWMLSNPVPSTMTIDSSITDCI